MMTVSSASRTPRALWSAMPQDLRRKSSEDYDAINPDFPPPSLKPPQNDGGREHEKQKKKDKKWSIGGLFRRKKKVSDTDSSSPVDDEEEKKGFLERRRAARKRRNRGSKDVTGSFEHVKISHINRPQKDMPDQTRTIEVANERLVGRSHESLAKRQPEVNHIRGSSVSLEGACKKGGRFQIKARVEASRERLKGDSSSDEGEGSSRHSTSSMQRLKCDESMGSKDGSLSRRSRAARTERYKKRLSRDDESLKDFQISPPSRISRSDERLTGKKADKTPSSNRWTAKVIYCESSDYDTKYTAKTKSATPSPIQSPKARPKNALHYTSSAPSGSTYVTYPPSHAREGVVGSYQELRNYHYPSSVIDHRHKQNQQFNDLTPPRLPKSSSEMITKGSNQNHNPKIYSWGQDKLNRKSASYDCNVNSVHFAQSKNQISQPHPTEENVLVVQFPISKPSKRGDAKIILSEKTPTQLYHVSKQQNPPPPPPRDPHRRLVPSNNIQHETSLRPMSYAFEDRNHHHSKYQTFPEFGSNVSAFQRVPLTNPIDIQPAVSINKHHRSNSDHHIPQKMNSVKYSPPMARRPSSVQHDYGVNRSYPVNNDAMISNSPKDIQSFSYQYYTDQQPRSRKPIHIGYQKTTNDPYLSDSQVVVKPPLQQTQRIRPTAVQNASEFWKQKDQENTKKVHVSEGSPKLIQRHLLNVNTNNERSRSNSPHADGNSVSSKLKLPPLIMPFRGGDSYGSFSGQSSPRDVPSPRTPTNRKLVHNEVGIPVFDVSELNNSAKREYRPLSMLEEKQETSEQEVLPVNDKLNNPPTPPTRRNSKVTNVSNFDNFDVFSDNELNETGRKSCNLEDALNELEAIYKSLRLNEDGYIEKVAKEKALYENNRLDPSNWNAWVQSRGFESDSSFNYSRSSLESVDSIDSPLKMSSRNRRSAVPDRVTDDMAYRRLNKKERPPPQEQEVISQAGSFLLVSPTLSPPPFIDAPIISPANKEPDITLDDVVYRNIKHVQNTLKISDPQPPFGIPLGPVTPAPNSDYLHVTPKETFRPTFKPRKIPDVVSDDLAFRNLRKDGNKEPLFPPEDTSLIDTPTLKKKRAVRSLSANLLSIIQKESASLKNSNKLIYNNNNNVNNDLEKSQSFTSVTDAVNLNAVNSNKYLPISLKAGDSNVKRNVSEEDSDVTPRSSRIFPVDNTSPSLATSTETLTGSKTSLWSQDTKHQQKLSQHSSPRLSLTPERRQTTYDRHTRTSISPSIQFPENNENIKNNELTTILPKLPDRQRSPTPDSHTYTHHSDKQSEELRTLYDDSESDLLAILAREAKEASEQLSKELYELNFDCKNNTLNTQQIQEPVMSKHTNDIKLCNSILLDEFSNEHVINKNHEILKTNEDIESIKTTKNDNLPHKTLPIGKIIQHKPVILNTFCITEDKKLENKQTVITQIPFEIEGSKSMSDLLKELTKSLDFDFGSPTKDIEESTPKAIDVVDMPVERRPEVEQSIDETKEVIHSDTNKHRTTDRKESDDNYYSSVEEIHEEHLSSPERALLSSLVEIPMEAEVTRLKAMSPTNSFPLEIPEEQSNVEQKRDVLEMATGDSEHSSGRNPDTRTSEPESGRCSMDCSSAADEGVY